MSGISKSQVSHFEEIDEKVKAFLTAHQANALSLDHPPT